MEKKTCFDIPCKIETKEDIAAAMEQNFLHLGKDYGRMLALARRARLQKPPALLRAKPVLCSKAEKNEHIRLHAPVHSYRRASMGSRREAFQAG